MTSVAQRRKITMFKKKVEATRDGVAHWDETGESSVFEMSVAEEEGIQVRELK